MELAGSLPCSQKPAIGPYTELVEFNPRRHNMFLKIFLIFSHLLLILPRGIPLRFFNQNVIGIAHFAIYSTWLTHIIIDLITITMSGEEY